MDALNVKSKTDNKVPHDSCPPPNAQERMDEISLSNAASISLRDTLLEPSYSRDGPRPDQIMGA